MIPFESTHKKLFITISSFMVLVGVVVLLFYVIKPRKEVIVPPPKGPIIIEGTIVCLPHKNTSGPQTMECAYGLLDHQQRYFTLRDSDPSFMTISSVPMNSTVEVIGEFSPAEDKTYTSIGIIVVTEISQRTESERISVEGIYDCLPHKDSTNLQTDECTYGVYTTLNTYYALDFGLTSQTVPELRRGDRISLIGVFTPIELLSTNHWDTYPIEGIISVTESVIKL